MRRRLYREDYPALDGRILTDTMWSADAVSARIALPDETPPFTQRLVGRCQDMRRERGGWVTGEIILFPELSDKSLEGLAAQPDFYLRNNVFPRANVGGRFDPLVMNDGVMGRVNTRLTMKGAIMCGVVFGKNPCWDGMF